MANNMFELHEVTKPSDITPFGEWLLLHSRLETPVAVAVKARQKKLALSTRDDAWVIDLKSPSGAMALGMVYRHLTGSGLKLMMRDTHKDLNEFTDLFHKEQGTDIRETFNALAASVVGDLTVASRCVNQAVTPANKFRRIDHDAFEIALLEPQYNSPEMPDYYERVGMPVSKAVAEGYMFARKAPAQWHVTYTDLWLRMLAFVTQDPTLTYAFAEGRDPFTDVAKLFKCSEFEAEVMLRYASCGFETDAFARRFPTRVNDLPDNTSTLISEVERKMPMLVFSTSQIKQTYFQTRGVATLYKRRLRPGHLPGEAVAFCVYGSVEDLVGVAVATFWQNRPSFDTMIKEVQGGPSDKTIRIVGTGPEQYTGRITWLNLLKQLAPLGQPLVQIDLHPLIVEL